MPTRHVVTITRTLTLVVDAPESVSQKTILDLAEKYPDSNPPVVNISSFEVDLQTVQNAERKILRLSDNQMKLTDSETDWAEGLGVS